MAAQRPRSQTPTKGSQQTHSINIQEKRRPYTIDYMAKLKEKMNLNIPLDAAVFACLTTCFYAAGQVREFMVMWLDRFDPAKHVTPANLKDKKD
jgi:hypothetical protein